MQEKNTSLAARRSSRVPSSIPILVTTVDTGARFSEVCETLVVSAHGCAMRSRSKLDTGVRLQFRSREGRNTTAQVVSCQPIGSDTQSWLLAARLDQPDNFWGLRNCPKDWAEAVLPPRTAVPQQTQVTRQVPSAISQPSTLTLDHTARQLSEEDVKRMIADSLRPIQSEAAALKEKLLRKEANPSRFDVSLSSIPPELEQQLELRLRKELEPKFLQEARQQATHLLQEAHAAITSETKGANENFSRLLADDRRALEQRAQEISSRISQVVRDRLGAGVNELQQKLVDGGNELRRLSHELFEFLKTSLNEEHDSRRAELQELRAMITAESSRLQDLTANLNSRIEKLEDSVCSLESGLDHRLNEMCSRTVKELRAELETAAGAALAEFTTRGGQALGNELNQVRAKMEAAQKDTLASVSESLDLRTRESLRVFEKSLQDVGGVSVEGWRLKIANGLSALAKSLSE